MSCEFILILMLQIYSFELLAGTDLATRCGPILIVTCLRHTVQDKVMFPYKSEGFKIEQTLTFYFA